MMARAGERGTLLVGTQVEGGLKLSDTTVSRVHLELQARPEGVRVREADVAATLVRRGGGDAA